jgi:hypothetical protein
MIASVQPSRAGGEEFEGAAGDFAGSVQHIDLVGEMRPGSHFAGTFATSNLVSTRLSFWERYSGRNNMGLYMGR